MCTGDLCRVPPTAVRHGRARQSSGTRPCVDCRRVPLVPGPRGQYSGIIRFIEKSGVQDQGVAMSLNVMSNLRYETESELSVLLPSLPHGVSVSGENSFYRAPGGAQKRVSLRRAGQSSGTGPFRDCRNTMWLPPPGSVFGQHSVYRKTWSTRRVGSACVGTPRKFVPSSCRR